MKKIKLSKNELKEQRDNLSRFIRFLPTLELRKKQIMKEVAHVKEQIDVVKKNIDRLNKDVSQWAGVFMDDVDISQLFCLKESQLTYMNIAGIEVPVFQKALFEDFEYDFFTTPLWVDHGIEVCKEQISMNSELDILQQQKVILQEELRIATQRIKLFEEVKIPQTKENIRMIQIYLGDQQTASVVRAKIAKKKIERKKGAMVHV